MITVALFNSLVVLCAYLARYKGYEFFLKISFFLIFLFLALRYNYGNDYSSYINLFLNTNNKDSIDYLDNTSHFESGWLFLCRLFEPLGFFAMVAVLAAFNCLVYYEFIRKYSPPDYYWLAVFLYVFDPAVMLVQSSAMRQSLAISLFIFSINYIQNKKLIRYIFCIGLASLFHTSALILLPVYLLGVYNFKTNKSTIVTLFVFYIFLYLIGNSLISYIKIFIESYLSQQYEFSEESGVLGTGLGLIVSSILFLFVLIYAEPQTKEDAFLFKISFLGYFIIPIGLVIFVLARMGMYFQIANIVVFPLILKGMKKRTILKTYFVLLVIGITMWGFYRFFQSDVWQESFGTYQTIFSSPEIY